MNNFSPKLIGKKNTELELKIVSTYYELCEEANNVLFCLDSYLGYPDQDKLDPFLFFEFMNSADPKSFLYSKYIECKGIAFPGISISKVIELGLVDVPLEAFSTLLEDRIKLEKIIQSTDELKFHYPLRNLWDLLGEIFLVIDVDENKCYKIVSPEFERQLNLHVGRFTSSESDNVVLEAIERAVDSLNGLIEIGVIGKEKGKWANGIAQLANAIVFDKNSNPPLSVNPRLNQLQDFRRFFTKSSNSPVMGNQADMLKFEGSDTLKEGLFYPVNSENLEQFEDPDTDQTKITETEVIQTK